jgi:3',5'-cyclic AMP phosphodiesterase CpdA
MYKNLFTFCLALVMVSCSTTGSRSQEGPESFTFVFLTDIHLKPELGAMEGFQMAIDSVNALKPDFVLTGGDLVDDALYTSHERADSLYQLYMKMSKGFQMPVYNAMGNHEHYGYNATPKVDPEHPDYGDRMFERLIGHRYYSFDHKGWHFIILEGTQKGDGNWGNYIGQIDEAQLDWIKEDLQNLDPETPIVVVTHIPLVSVMPQINNGPLYAENQSTLIINQREVLAPFRNMNLKLVLQGHLHALEEINLMDQVQFITGGAVCGQWWKTADDAPLQEGFLKIKVTGQEFTWDYVDYGWETGISSK